MFPHQNIFFKSLYKLFPLGCTECGVLWPSSRIFFFNSSTTRTHSQLWNRMVPLWIINPGAFPTNISSLIRSSCRSVAYAIRIPFKRVGWASIAQKAALAQGVSTLSSILWNSSCRSTGSPSRQFSAEYNLQLRASALTFAFPRCYWKFIS